ncbi:Enhancin [Alphabaculovirus myunipunctae]|uniref:Enhancin n=1 Tax=Mythimna unipuncta nucleopolyhedrovirus TaxID=447897 RepID=A0A2K9VSA6_9ABAC|nr:Enhancin [Mythimna unipuncta nucleopolyhedrovirus]AUV65345.1 Enhancin [Mythimna unipuncta nucleopolyhedrovirus]
MSNMSGSIPIPYISIPAWIPQTERFFGIHHYKKPIPYVLKEGCVVDITTNHACTILVLNDDNSKETITRNVNGPLTIEIEVDSVVFVNCIFDDNADGNFRITYKLSGGGDDDDDDDDDEDYYDPLQTLVCGENNVAVPYDGPKFVFVEGDYVQLLVPAIDFRHINEIIAQSARLAPLNDYYNSIIEFYDDLTGIDIKRKYFIKADISGPGGGYYAQFFMGESYSSIKAFYLTFEASNFGCLHEIGHSFDTYFTRSHQINLQETWTNIMPDYYQYTHMTTEEYQISGWIYDYGNRDRVIRDFISIYGRLPPQRWSSHRQRLIFITAFFYRVGHRTLLRIMYDELIKFASNNQSVNFDFRVMDIMMRVFDERFNIDVTPVMRDAKICDIDENLALSIRNNRGNTVNVNEFMVNPDSLSFHLTAGETYDTIVNEARLLTTLSVPDDLVGAHYALVQNSTRAHYCTFNGDRNAQRLPSMVPGCYKVLSETGNGPNRYIVDDEYVYYDGTTMRPETLTIRPMINSPLLNEVFLLAAFDDRISSIFTIDYTKNEYRLDFLNLSPHSHFGSNVYYRIEIVGVIVWSVKGRNTTSEFDWNYTVPMSVGQKIIIYHREFRRRLLSNFTTTLNTNEFIVTEYGVQHVEGNVESMPLAFSDKVVRFCNNIQQNYPTLVRAPFVQDSIFTAYNLLTNDSSSLSSSSLYETVSKFLPDTSVTSMTALDSTPINMMRARQLDGVLHVQTYALADPDTSVQFSVVRGNRQIFQLDIESNVRLVDFYNSIVLMPNDRIDMRMDRVADNKRFLVIDGVNQTLSSSSDLITYIYKPHDTDSSTSSLLVIIGIIFAVIIVLFIIYKLIINRQMMVDTNNTLTNTSTNTTTTTATTQNYNTNAPPRRPPRLPQQLAIRR